MDWDQLEQDAFCYLNISPHELYELTHREYINMIKGYNSKRELELKDKQYLAWHITTFVAMSFSGEKLPSLEEIMKSNDKQVDPATMTEEQIYNRARSTIRNMVQAGMDVPEETLIKYNLKRG